MLSGTLLRGFVPPCAASHAAPFAVLCRLGTFAHGVLQGARGAFCASVSGAFGSMMLVEKMFACARGGLAVVQKSDEIICFVNFRDAIRRQKSIYSGNVGDCQENFKITEKAPHKARPS